MIHGHNYISHPRSHDNGIRTDLFSNTRVRIMWSSLYGASIWRCLSFLFKSQSFMGIATEKDCEFLVGHTPNHRRAAAATAINAWLSFLPSHFGAVCRARAYCGVEMPTPTSSRRGTTVNANYVRNRFNAIERA